MPQASQPATLAGLLLRSAERSPAREALVFPGERFTYAQLRDGAVRAARSLAALGVGRGDRVGLLLPNCPDFALAFFGAQLLDAVVVPVNTRFRSRELGYLFENAELKVLLTSDIVDEHVDFVERIGASLSGLESADPERLALPDVPRLQTIVLLGEREAPGMLGRGRFDALGDETSAEHVLEGTAGSSPDDIALMLYTSGTTAEPKGCVITHDAAIHVWTSAGERLRIMADDRAWDPLPLFHMSCLGPLIFTTALGGTLVTMTHFEPAAALDQIEQERTTWLYSVFPPITMALVTHPSFEARDLSRVRGLLNVAPPDTMRLIQASFPGATNVGGHFGMTEASGAITCNEWDASPDEQAETHGAPLPETEVRAVDPETGVVQPAGVPGELLVRGRGLFRGYYRDPELTARALEGGWLHSGDLGVIDEQGLVTYLARLKDMLKVGGENVAPAEIESHLSTHPAVKLVQVVGAPDERLGEVVAAFVEVAPGREATAEELIEYCRGSIASYKVPRFLRFVDEWPMSATKIQKFQLRERIAAELAAPTR